MHSLSTALSYGPPAPFFGVRLFQDGLCDFRPVSVIIAYLSCRAVVFLLLELMANLSGHFRHL